MVGNEGDTIAEIDDYQNAFHGWSEA